MVKKLFERLTKKSCKRQTKQSLELNRNSTGKMIKYLSNEKVMRIHLTVG